MIEYTDETKRVGKTVCPRCQMLILYDPKQMDEEQAISGHNWRMHLDFGRRLFLRDGEGI